MAGVGGAATVTPELLRPFFAETLHSPSLLPCGFRAFLKAEISLLPPGAAPPTSVEDCSTCLATDPSAVIRLACRSRLARNLATPTPSSEPASAEGPLQLALEETPVVWPRSGAHHEHPRLAGVPKEFSPFLAESCPSVESLLCLLCPLSSAFLP